MIIRSRLFMIIMIACLACISLLFSLSKGSTSLSLYQLLFNDQHQFKVIFLQLRLPRTLTAFVSGGLLALSGSLMQLLLQNPLADPYVLGVSGGAGVVTLFLMALGVSDALLFYGAWFGSLSTILIIFLLAKKHRWQQQHLLLSGVAMAMGYSACMSLILLMSSHAALHNMLFWLTGDLNNAHFPKMGLFIFIIGLIICMALAPGFNVLLRGEKEARALGLAARPYQIAIYLLSSLFAATAVTLVGCVGFIGLIIPHLTRKLIGYDHRFVIPLSALLGGGLLTFADTLASTLIAPEQLPVGALMALIGVPVFIGLLQR